MKKVLSIIVSVILVSLLCVTGVFADSDFSSQPIPLLTSYSANALTFNSSYLFGGWSNGSWAAFSSNSDSIYVFGVPDGNGYDIYFCAVDSGQNVTILRYYNGTYEYQTGFNNGGLSNQDSTTFLYYRKFDANNSSAYCPVFNSASDGFSAVLNISSSSTNTYHLVLPYGNVLRISSDSDFAISRRAYSIQNSTYNFQKYVRASDDFTYRVNGSYQGIALNSAITGTFGPAVFGSDNVLSLLIPWQPVNQNILGRATDYNYYNASPDPTAEVSVLSSQSFLIWYPYYANNQDTSKLNEVPMQISIDIVHSGAIYFTTYPITGSTSSTGEDTYISNTASTTESGGSQQTDDGDGNVVVSFDNAPTAGGNHGQAPINDNNSILGVLSNLQNVLLGLFNKAIDGIHNLITLGSSFLQSVQVMFSWLPSELLVIITSGFVILLTIGVLKTLWR